MDNLQMTEAQEAQLSPTLPEARKNEGWEHTARSFSEDGYVSFTQALDNSLDAGPYFELSVYREHDETFSTSVEFYANTDATAPLFRRELADNEISAGAALAQGLQELDSTGLLAYGGHEPAQLQRTLTALTDGRITPLDEMPRADMLVAAVVLDNRGQVLFEKASQDLQAADAALRKEGLVPSEPSGSHSHGVHQLILSRGQYAAEVELRKDGRWTLNEVEAVVPRSAADKFEAFEAAPHARPVRENLVEMARTVAYCMNSLELRKKEADMLPAERSASTRAVAALGSEAEMAFGPSANARALHEKVGQGSPEFVARIARMTDKGTALVVVQDQALNNVSRQLGYVPEVGFERHGALLVKGYEEKGGAQQLELRLKAGMAHVFGKEVPVRLVEAERERQQLREQGQGR